MVEIDAFSAIVPVAPLVIDGGSLRLFTESVTALEVESVPTPLSVAIILKL